jgi:hypothetical protein
LEKVLNLHEELVDNGVEHGEFQEPGREFESVRKVGWPVPLRQWIDKVRNRGRNPGSLDDGSSLSKEYRS